jgi:hypothetical protein
MNQHTRCIFCQQPVELHLAETPPAVRAWRMFECPRCLRANFRVLMSPIIAALLVRHEPDANAKSA